MRIHQWHTRKPDLTEYQRSLFVPEFDSSDWFDGPIGQARALIMIERFVERAMRSNEPAFQFSQSSQGWIHVETGLGQKLKRVLSLLHWFDSWHHYREHALAFLDACWLVESVYGFHLQTAVQPWVAVTPHIADALNVLIDKIRMSASQEWFKRGSRDRQYEANEKTKTLSDYLQAIFSRRRTLVVRVDFRYSSYMSSRVTIDEVYSHLDRLLYLKDRYPAFEHLRGYAWVIEQSERHGYHIHAVFMFDGSKVCHDIQKGFQIGHLWMQVTDGEGLFHNCNAHKNQYRECGLGMVFRDSAEAGYALKHLMYLTKDTSYLRMKPAIRSKTFGTGIA